ncbi:FkbM family methyltransferase [Fulvivirga maritima]|nr:FkbM family methyltransferase [Fulvivirga maritima]
MGNINEVHLQNLGLGANKERRKLYFDTEGSGWASVFERMDTGFNQKLDKSEEITLTSLDDFCYENDIRQIDFLKADVEGFELEVFHGSKNMLPYIYFIQFEFSFANYNSKTYLKDFFELLADFDIYRVINDGISKIDYDPRYEILLTSNYLAVNKKLNIEF